VKGQPEPRHGRVPRSGNPSKPQRPIEPPTVGSTRRQPTLTPRGTYVVVDVKEQGRRFGLARQIKALLLSPFVRQRMRVFVVKHAREDLAVLKTLVEAGKVAPVLDRRYTLSDVPEALRYQGEGHAQGKIVIAV
jgi:NADPH:quinone reductase-like Zn-dependent oxidoreductase